MTDGGTASESAHHAGHVPNHDGASTGNGEKKARFNPLPVLVARWKVTLPLLFVTGIVLLFGMSAPCLDNVRSPAVSPAYASQTVRLQLAGSPAAAAQVIADWKAGCIDRALPGFNYQSEVSRNLRWDSAFLLCYALFLIVALGALVAHMTSFVLRFLGIMLSFTVLVAAALDVLENALMHSMISSGAVGSVVAAIIKTASTLKFGLLAIVLTYILVALVHLVTRSWSKKSELYEWAGKNPSEHNSQHAHTVSTPHDAHDLPGAQDEAATLTMVRHEELAYLQHHRHPDKSPHIVGQNLVGLCLSGGGIRAATTSLGMVQALSRLGVLPFVDYLSTVSGGGYLGACLSSLLSLNEAAIPGEPTKDVGANANDACLFDHDDSAAFTTEWATFPFRDDQSRNHMTKTLDSDTDDQTRRNVADNERGNVDSQRASRAAQIIAHLRTHGNFLIARRGMLTRDTLRAIGSLATGITFQLLTFLLVLLAGSALYLSVIATSVGNVATTFNRTPPDTATVAVQDKPQPLADTIKLSTTESVTNACAINALGCASVTHADVQPAGLSSWISFELSRAGSVVTRATTATITESDFALRASLLSALFIGVFATLLNFAGLNIALGLFEHPDPLTSPQSGESVEEVFDKTVLWFCALVTLWLLILASVAWHQSTSNSSAGLIVLWLPLATVVGARVMSFVVAIVLPRIVSARRWSRRLRTLWNAYQASLTYGIWLSLIFLLLAPLMFAMAEHGPTLTVSALVALAVTRFLAPSRKSGKPGLKFLPVGVRNFFLGSSVFAVILLCCLTFGAYVISHVNPSQYLLWGAITTAVVALLGVLVDSNIMSLHYFYRDRLAETYLLSELPDTKRKLWTFRDAIELPLHRLHGDSNSDQKSANSWRNSAPYHLITAAINLAGTRELTRKDRKSGHWLFSKLYCGSIHTDFRPTAIYRGGETKLARAVAISGAAVSSGMGFMTFFAQSFATVLFNLRLGYWTENPRLASSQSSGASFVFWPLYLWREMAMRTNDRTKLVNLSDGGHTGDNCGVYPLLQRRCKVIIVGDAEEDKGLSFGSFTEVLRHAYVDDGIKVDIDLSMIHADAKTGFSRKHCAVGRIRYPDRPLQESYLIYLKNSLTGDEAEAIMNYRSICPDFPHESTVDQFFNDAQFESYRALGEHVANAAFESWSHTSLFTQAQQMHAPAPAITPPPTTT